MSFSIGIIGLPNVGKSTLFKALTKKQIDIANYPFTTIDPNVGVVKVPDERLDKLAEVLKPKEIIPTHIKFVDIAGLVKGAHQGEGLGNKFLSHIREVDAICHLVRDFEDKNVAHISGKVDSKSDIEIINLELIFADLKTVERRLGDLVGKARSGDKEAAKIIVVLEKMKTSLDNGKTANTVELSDDERILIKDLSLLTLKPILYVFNASELKIQKESSRSRPNSIIVSAKIESELSDLPENEAQEYIKELGLKSSGLDQLITASYKLLNLITFFTCQNNILQAWTVREGAKAPEAAGRVHTDFEKDFIRAEVINWQNLIKCGSESAAREKGLIHTEGKEYIVQDGDVINIKI